MAWADSRLGIVGEGGLGTQPALFGKWCCRIRGVEPVVTTSLGLGGRRSGKVRDLYELGAGADGAARLLMVATDRISAYDVVMPTPIPGKGRLLTEIALGWFGLIDAAGLCANHVLSSSLEGVEGLGEGERRMLEGRSMVVRACRVVPVECVARGYLDGSGWREYEATGRVCGVGLPGGLRRGDRLGEPIFTPATKASEGHDENIDFDRACAIAGGGVMERLREATLSIYRYAHEYALERGMVLADTKFEFGFPIGADGREASAPILVDEALTPDSSRYWALDGWAPGGVQPSFDKQFLREYLEGLVARGAWDKRAPGPELPASIVEGTAARYREARERLFSA